MNELKNVLLALFHYVRGWARKGIELLGEDWQYKLFFGLLAYGVFCIIAGAVGLIMTMEVSDSIIGAITLWTVCCFAVIGLFLNSNMMSEPLGFKGTFWASIGFSAFCVTSSFIGVGLVTLAKWFTG